MQKVLSWSMWNVAREGPGPSCSKLTTSLVNDSLKFTPSDMQICWNFLLKNVSSFRNAKATHIFSAKNIRILYIESAKTVNEMTLNELVKLTMLWTTGPWASSVRLGPWCSTYKLNGYSRMHQQTVKALIRLHEQDNFKGNGNIFMWGNAYQITLLPFLTHCRQNRLPYIIYQKSPIQFRYIPLRDLVIPREKRLNY